MLSGHPSEAYLTPPPPNFSSDVEALHTLRESEINFISQGIPEKAGGPNRSADLREEKEVLPDFIVSRGWDWGEALHHGLHICKF